MQRLLLVMAVLIVASSAFGQTNGSVRKGSNCQLNADGSRGPGYRDRCANRKKVTARTGKRSLEPTIERDGYVIHRRDDGAVSAGGGGY